MIHRPVFSALQSAALAGLAVCNLIKARREVQAQQARGEFERFKLFHQAMDLGREQESCRTTHTRPTGEVVHCVLPRAHEGHSHVGSARGISRYGWLDQDSDTEEDCGCNATLLQADIAQSNVGSDLTWAWRIYDTGCNDKERVFAEGSSDTLDQARADVVHTMQVLAETNGFAMAQPEFIVTHHALCPVQFTGVEP